MSPENNDLLCRVEGAAPMGQIMRRHWLPAALSEELAERDGDPVRVRLLGEDLVAFRDSDGKIGLVGEFCPHRNASLFYGRNEECGLRCLYHGWKVAADGTVLEMPSEPPERAMARKVKHKSYPTHEAAGIVWAYMGPESEIPEFEPPVFLPAPGTRIAIGKVVVNCNWAQILEGAIDSAHSSTLHVSDMLSVSVDTARATDEKWLRPSGDKAPRLQVQTTDFGFRYVAIRRPLADADMHDYIRMTLFIAPYTVLIPPLDRYRVALVHVPVDDTHTAFHFIAFGCDSTPDEETWRKFLALQPGIDVDENWRNRRSRSNNYLQDREAMNRGSWTGISGIPNQDIVMWESMGPIAGRNKERLGASDVAIVAFRRQMLEAARQMQAGGSAIGTGRSRTPHASLRSFEGIVPKGTDWRSLGAIEAAE
ncbi:MAG: Rieske 2Fe-2S domain-containing protein [Alphaproteobacteria bacterium]|nr:Rieske 2Fe-2S domain-containing protein [Alphaproteobacteria bacterium]